MKMPLDIMLAGAAQPILDEEKARRAVQAQATLVGHGAV